MFVLLSLKVSECMPEIARSSCFEAESMYGDMICLESSSRHFEAGLSARTCVLSVCSIGTSEYVCVRFE